MVSFSIKPRNRKKLKRNRTRLMVFFRIRTMTMKLTIKTIINSREREANIVDQFSLFPLVIFRKLQSKCRFLKRKKITISTKIIKKRITIAKI